VDWNVNPRLAMKIASPWIGMRPFLSAGSIPGQKLCKPNYQLTGTTPDDLVRLVLESAKKAV
jgi:hypothetical protein